MANQNFVVHNGLTVGQTTIDAATSNVSIPVGKQILIGNVIMRDNGDGKVSFRDSTDNSDAILVATISSPSVTQGNIQIGTNHIESINPSGPISIRPNLDGAVGLFSNTIAFGKGGNPTTLTTGAVLDSSYGVNYTPSNIIIQTGGALSSGNVRIGITTAASSTATGAFQVMGGASVVGSLYVGGGFGAGGTLGASGQVLQSTGTGVQWASADQILNGGSNVRVNTDWVNVSVGGTNVASFGGTGLGSAGTVLAGNLIIRGNLFVAGNVTTISANNLIIEDSLIYLADSNPTDLIDAGIVSSFTSGAGYQHTGFVRDASDGIWKLFAGVTTEPTTTIDFTSATYSSLQVGNISTVSGWANIGSTVNAGGNLLAKAGTLSSLTINGTTTSQGIVPAASNTYSVGSTTAWYSSFWGAAVNAQYADLAEKYASDAWYEPGTVLMFGGDAEVTQCTDDMSTAVAGVVSTNPAYLMNHQITGDNIVDLALTGRVPTKVTGSVKKGDMMVAAGGGRARAEANPRVGSVIGKALENSEGDNIIEVVVGKH